MTAISAWPDATQEALEKAFGKIEVDRQGEPTERWEARTLRYMSTPFPLELSFRPGEHIQGVRCHTDVRASLSRVFSEINRIPADDRIAKGLNVFFGCYKPLDMISGILSPHAWGAGISMGRGKDAISILSPLFAAEGWRSFGKDKRGIFMAVY